MGGQNDPTHIKGTKRTYVDSQPGIFIKEMQRLECKNPVIVIDEIDKCIKSADKQIADAGAKRHSDLLEELGVSASVNTKDAISAEFEALIKLGLMSEDKHTAVKADQIRT